MTMKEKDEKGERIADLDPMDLIESPVRTPAVNKRN